MGLFSRGANLCLWTMLKRLLSSVIQKAGMGNNLVVKVHYYLDSSLYLYNNDRFSNRLFIWLYMTEKYSGCWS